jgi:hypothetical protein
MVSYYDRIPLRATSNALQRDGRNTCGGDSVLDTAPGISECGVAFPVRLLASITTIDSEYRNSYAIRRVLQPRAQIASSNVSLLWLRLRQSLHVNLSASQMFQRSQRRGYAEGKSPTWGGRIRDSPNHHPLRKLG